MLADERALGLPPGLQVHLQPKFAQNPIGDAVGPAPRFGTFVAYPALGQVHDGGQLALRAQGTDRVSHQTGFATGPGRQDIAELPVAKALQERLVRGSRDVARPIRLNDTAHDEKLTRLCDLRQVLAPTDARAGPAPTAQAANTPASLLLDHRRGITRAPVRYPG